MSTQAPLVHSVHIYSEPAALISRLCGIVHSGLRIGDAVLIVITAEHRKQLLLELQRDGLDLRTHARQGLFTMVDANEMLSTFMLDGMPDRDLFAASVGEVLVKARSAARSKGQGLTVFGEMVAVLWDEGKKAAALQLEALWNQTLHQRSFHLHCAYPRGGFVSQDDEIAVCNSHSHIVM